MDERACRPGPPGDAEGARDHLGSPTQFIWHYISRWRAHFAALAAAILLAASCAVAVQFEMKLLIDAMAGEAPHTHSAVWAALTAFIGLIAAESLLWRVSGWIGCKATLGAGVEMRADLFSHLGGHPISYFLENRAGSLGQRITATAGNFGALANTVTWRIAPPCVDFAGAMVVFSMIDWRMALVLGTAVPAIAVGLLLLGKKGKPLHKAYAAEAGETAGELTDVISNMWAIKAFSARVPEGERLVEKFRKEAAIQRRSWMYIERIRLLFDVVLWVVATTILCWAVYRWQERGITSGDVVIVSALTFRILHGVRDLVLSLVDIGQQFGFIEETLSLIGSPPLLTDGLGSCRLQRGGGSIEFRDVSFGYRAAGEDAIRNLKLCIPSGQKVGIVGPSGAGKSTLISLIQRLYDAQEGEVLVGGRSVRSVTQDSLRDALAVVPQEVSLFHRSVMENIRIARPSATDEEIFAAARAALCDGFVQGLPYGYHTVVGERGAKLSGGQRQRIGLARAFLKMAPIVIFDEATSALDSESEILLQKAVVDLMGGHTVIAVAHRISSILAFDRVLVMQNGTVVEDGRPADLLQQAGHFRRIWRLQSGALGNGAPAFQESRPELHGL
ncbi:ABC transporter ATP-binding protein [Roseomonas hellenica]|uniref:ABC transporter ATP-binding protein n=1 Tax=Plastoroseomonas hellenica TaxID=2687306 RepID=A0ABS5EVZ6_9PROT|nr:ABC transporter ATP-binding protein [Plastoroseomonas hellenica]MBR0664471.1 ABC transporter ATP-binding protein [Plastoroseomonas hellenica]